MVTKPFSTKIRKPTKSSKPSSNPETQLESFDPLTIPFKIIQTKISAKNNDNESIGTNANAVVVTIPL
jgi:hypothetical protein